MGGPVRSRVLILMAAVWVLVGADAEKPAPPEPTDAYDLREIEGWPVRVNKRFARDDPKQLDETLKLLSSQLYQITRVVPAAALNDLKTVTIWVERDEGHHPCMVYHPDADWLREHNMNPAKASCVEIANAERFLEWTKDQPWMVLHEMAHAYHHQFLPDGFGNQDVIDRFHQATVVEKRYDEVQHINGAIDCAYAACDVQEFFAECSEALFGTNDFYPFVRSELQTHDPDTHALLKRLWRVEN